MKKTYTKTQLQLMARVAGLPVSGSKAALAARLRRGPRRTPSTALSGKTGMSRACYRRRLARLGLIERDQDVFHIIAAANGGADHPDNYHCGQNGSLNRAIGSRYDHINCYLAGRAKARKAVAVSRRLGSYRGPSAAKLYRLGERHFSTIRTTKRKKINK